MTTMKITVTMHQMLRLAADRKDGAATGDNGVRTALLRRGLVTQDGPDLVINETGRWAIDHARLDPRAQPTSMTDAQFQHYLQKRKED